jgi:3-oxoadipate enol-lactonase
VRLEDCADDVIRVADALGVERIVPVGYSMGGAIAQLVWQRHPEARDERLSFLGLTGLAALARVTPGQARDWISDQVYLQRKTQTWGPWAVSQAARHDWRMVLEAGRALGSFSSLDWIGEIDVPVSIVVTMRDPVVPLRRQVRLFEAIEHAAAFRVDGEHDAIVAVADRFVPTLVRATRHALGTSR